MDLKNKRDAIIFTLIIIILTGIVIGNMESEPEKVLKWNFKGVVEHVRYDDKRFPWVIVNGKEYNLYYTTWNFNVKINKGDTIIKKEGDKRIKIIKKYSRDTLVFKKRDDWIIDW